MSLYEFIYEENKNRQDNIAINYFNRKWTYRDLFEQIDLYAKAMRSQGIREGDAVSILYGKYSRSSNIILCNK